MGMDGDTAYILARNFVKATANGLGAVRGKNCTVSGVVGIYDDPEDPLKLTAQKVTLRWTGDNNAVQEREVILPAGKDGKDGHTPTDEEIEVAFNTYVTNHGIDQRYTNTVGVAQNIGGIKAGEKFQDTPVIDVLNKLFSAPYTKPSIVVTADCDSLNDPVTTQLNSIAITAKITKGTEDIQYAKFYVNNTLVKTELNPTNMTLTCNYTPASPVKTSLTLKVEICDAETRSIVHGTKEIQFYPKSYYGSIADGVDITPVSVGTLTTVLKNTKVGTYNFTSVFGRFVYAYPKSLGSISSIKDNVNNLNYTNSVTTTEMKINNYDYYVISLTDPSGFENVPITFA